MKENKIKKIRVVMELTPGSRPAIMLEEINLEKGYPRNTTAFLEALSVLHRKTFPASYYGSSGKSKLIEDENEDDPEESLAKSQARKDLKVKQEHNRLLAIANLIDHVEIYQDPQSGSYRVKYYTYSGRSRYERIVPLESVTEEMSKRQYYPDKQKCLQMLESKKQDYKIADEEREKLLEELT